MEDTPLQKYEWACTELLIAFIESLYPDQDDRDRILKEPEGYWVGGVVGEVFAWWGCFVYSDSMADYFRYELTPYEFFKWYDQYINEKGGGVNMKAFKLLNTGSNSTQ